MTEESFHSNDSSSSRNFRAGFAPLRASAERAERVVNAEFAPGEQIGRFRVEGVLGTGGMSLVYAAHDPQLGRTIALKLLLPPREGGPDVTDEARLQREAQALARLSHPGIVAVYDVGSHLGRMWLAMEFVEGRTVRDWATERPHRWMECLRVLVATAEGVAAAHAAGLIHRDLKPENVMVGKDGRVRVMDFGLVRQEPGAAGAAIIDRLAHQDSDESGVRLTRTGAVMGSPAYMAPEQWEGQQTRPATDVYAWSVMAWELLYGRRPYEGRTIAELRAQVLSGRLGPRPKDRRVPPWLGRIVEHGLASNPAARWQSMPELLAEVARKRRRDEIKKASILLVSLTTVVVGLTGAVRYAQREQRVATCVTQGKAIETLWNDDARTTVADALLDTRAPFASATATNVLRRLDDYAAAWRMARIGTCHNEAVAEIWNRETAQSAEACLDDASDHMSTLIESLSNPGEAEVGRRTAQGAVAAVARLPEPTLCVDEHELRKHPRLPEDPAHRQEVRRVRYLLARARALSASGRHDESLILAMSSQESADALKWPSLQAAATYQRGRALRDLTRPAEAEKVLESAFFAAAASGDDGLFADSAAFLAFLVGVDAGRHEDGIRWGKIALAIQDHTGVPPDDLRRGKVFSSLGTIYKEMGALDLAIDELERARVIWENTEGDQHPDFAGVLDNLGDVYRRKAEWDRAISYYESSLTTFELVYGPNHPRIATSLNNLGILFYERGNIPRALDLYRRALLIRERVFGARHPAVAETILNLGALYLGTGELHDALDLHMRAASIWTDKFGPDHINVGVALGNLAQIHEKLGDYERAIELNEQVLGIWARKLEPTHPNVAATLGNLANVYKTQERFVEAIDTYKRALAILDQSLGSEHPRLIPSLNNLGRVYSQIGKHELAVELHQRALMICDRNLDPDHESIGYSITGLGIAYLGLNRPEMARPLLEKAVVARENRPAKAAELFETRFALARSLWPDSGQRQHAVELVERALADVESELMPANPVDLDEARAWLMSHTQH